MDYENQARITFTAVSRNEGFARACVAAFLLPLDPTVDEMMDVKTAVSEAVTNAVIHGYDGEAGEVALFCGVAGRELFIEVADAGRGIEDVARAREALYTGKPGGERSGMGFTVMEAFMDSVDVQSAPGAGTTVRLRKRLA